MARKGWKLAKQFEAEARPNTKWFNYNNAKKIQIELSKKGIDTHIVKTTKINRLSGKRSPAYLVKKTHR